MVKAAERPKPVLLPPLCKGCGRCIDACPRHCIEMGHEIDQASGLVPAVIDYEVCNGCGVCISACPEPFGLGAMGDKLQELAEFHAQLERPREETASVPDTQIPLPKREPLVLKGNHAAAIGALLAGCRHVFAYPITPSTEGAELMAKILPEVDGVFLQAVSEVAVVNHMYGCGAAGMPSLTFTSSPGFSLMLEGISYMIGAEVPAVFVNVMRGGPGLGNIGPEQGDIKLVCRGLGHGNTHSIILAPSTPQEMLDLTMQAFRLAFRYRNPVIVLADGYLGQMTGRVRLPDELVRPGVPGWAVWGDEAHRRNLINSFHLAEVDLEEHNRRLAQKYASMEQHESRANLYRMEDAEILLVSCNTPARLAKGSIESLRREGIRAGLFHPVTLWPFPIDALTPHLDQFDDILVVEASNGQLEDELRLALSHANVAHPHIHRLRHLGGVLPQKSEIQEKVRSILGGRR